MSTFLVEVCELRNVHKHPNADTLSCGLANGSPVIFRTDEYREGDLVVYVPVDAIVPATPEWDWLGSSRRIRAKKLRGIYSEGLIVANKGWALGQNVQELLGITKWLPPSERADTSQAAGTSPRRGEKCPYVIPYYDIEGYRKYSHVLIPNEKVCVTEKLHGMGCMYMHDGTRLWVKSRNVYWAPQREGFWRRLWNKITGCPPMEETNRWWQIAKKYDLENKLKHFSGLAFYGEILGPGIQDLTYGLKEPELRLFDIYNVEENCWLGVDDFLNTAFAAGLPTVPELYRGSYSDALAAFSEGKTTFNADHVREGCVIRPMKERWDARIGRVQVKLAGQGYFMRKGQPE